MGDFLKGDCPCFRCTSRHIIWCVSAKLFCRTRNIVSFKIVLLLFNGNVFCVDEYIVSDKQKSTLKPLSSHALQYFWKWKASRVTKQIVFGRSVVKRYQKNLFLYVQNILCNCRKLNYIIGCVLCMHLKLISWDMPVMKTIEDYKRIQHVIIHAKQANLFFSNVM